MLMSTTFICSNCGAAEEEAPRRVGADEFCEQCYNSPPKDSALTRKELQEFILNPLQFYEAWKKLKQAEKPRAYIVTFTRNPNSVHTLDKWFLRIRKELTKKSIISFEAVVEHRDTNIHLHAFVCASKQLNKRDYKVFERDYGYVDVRRVHTDNGIADYFVKEEGAVLITDPQNIK